MNPYDLGKKGEQIAQQFYIQQGYFILDTNYRFEKNEIDFVAFNLKELVFVEVKARSSEEAEYPERAVNAQKQQKIKLAAQSYLYEKRMETCPCRFDVIAIVFYPNGEHQIHPFIDAFR